MIQRHHSSVSSYWIYFHRSPIFECILFFSVFTVLQSIVTCHTTCCRLLVCRHAWSSILQNLPVSDLANFFEFVNLFYCKSRMFCEVIVSGTELQHMINPSWNAKSGFLLELQSPAVFTLCLQTHALLFFVCTWTTGPMQMNSWMLWK